MSSTVFTSTDHLLQHGEQHSYYYYSRRLLLLHSSLHKLTFAAAPSSAATHDPPESYGGGDSSFDTNVVMVLSVLLCALICSLGLNSIIRCALKCSRLVVSDSDSADHRRPAVAAAGVNRKAIKSFTVVQFSPELNLPGLDAECIICLADFAAGDKLRLLPKCNHGFHVKCIDKWLSSHSSCPKCRQCLVHTCQKIAGVGGSGQPPPSAAAHDGAVVNISPLDPEGPVRNLWL